MAANRKVISTHPHKGELEKIEHKLKHFEGQTFVFSEVEVLINELAAEREKADNLFKVARKHCVENQQLKSELAAERQLRLQETDDANRLTCEKTELEQQLLSALAAIEKHNKEWENYDAVHRQIYVDLSVLHQHDAEVRKPLMGLLLAIKPSLQNAANDTQFAGQRSVRLELIRKIDALAKAKP